MNKTPKLWEILAAFIPVIAGIVIWLWDLGIQVQEQKKDIEYLQQDRVEYKKDITEIKQSLQTILIRIENKADRK